MPGWRKSPPCPCPRGGVEGPGHAQCSGHGIWQWDPCPLSSACHPWRFLVAFSFFPPQGSVPGEPPKEASQLDLLLSRLRSCVSKDLADELAVNFCYMQVGVGCFAGGGEGRDPQVGPTLRARGPRQL